MAAPDAEARAALRNEVLQYTAVDDRIRALNTQLNELRQQRSLINDRLVAIVSEPAFAAANELASPDGSRFRIKRPGTWREHKALSMTELRALLIERLGDRGVETYEFVRNRHNAGFAQSYCIERVVAPQ
jgi:hypothetical protein